MRGLVLAVVTLALGHLPVAAQDLPTLVERVTDGTVRVTFPIRKGVCASGENMRFYTRARDNADWEPTCDTGPGRVVIERRSGQTMSLDTYIGGRWRARGSVTDLGIVTGSVVADLLLGMADRLDADIAKDAIYAAALADAVVWPRLVRLAQNRQRPSVVRQQAVFWAGQVGGDEVVSALVGMLDDADAEFREKVVFALAQTRNEKGSTALRELVTDRTADLPTREKAIFWLGQSGGEGHAAFLQDAFGTIGNENLREKIIFAMSQGRSDANADWLTDSVVLARGVSEALREKAVFWLGQMRGQGSRLVGLYDRVQTDALREKLIFAYSQRPDDVMVDKLVEIAGDDRRPELRRKAIFWLGQSRHPKAIQALADLIGS